jgi:putative phosphoribosyl transferase
MFVDAYLQTHTTFRDRHHAGAVLAERLRSRVDPGTVVLALPRGGVPVGFEVATRLGLDLDVFTVRKLSLPWNPEAAIGAIASGGVIYVDQQVVGALGVSRAELERVLVEAERELERREDVYRGTRPVLEIADRPVVLVDDGLATGASMRAAIVALRERRPGSIVVAVPIGAASACTQLSCEVDDMVCAMTPVPFTAVGTWYQDFHQVSDDEVRWLLDEAARDRAGRPTLRPHGDDSHGMAPA